MPTSAGTAWPGWCWGGCCVGTITVLRGRRADTLDPDATTPPGGAPRRAAQQGTPPRDRHSTRRPSNPSSRASDSTEPRYPARHGVGRSRRLRIHPARTLAGSLPRRRRCEERCRASAIPRRIAACRFLQVDRCAGVSSLVGIPDLVFDPLGSIGPLVADVPSHSEPSGSFSAVPPLVERGRRHPEKLGKILHGEKAIGEFHRRILLPNPFNKVFAECS
jgi:hypothetical protein